MKFETKAIHVGEEPNLKEGGSGDVVVPIHLSSTFARREIDKPTGGYEYSRAGNPTRLALERKLAALENAKYGLAFASGLAAESVVLMTLLKSGDHVVAFNDLYGGTKRLFNLFNNFKIEFSYVDATDSENIKNAIKANTKMIWLETPTNPMMRLSDIQQASEIAKANNLILVVDNTFSSPYLQSPLELGADIVIHSTTKYINGHSDSVGGAIMLSNDDLFKQLKFNQNAIGAILSPFDSYLVARGVKTLALRMEQHSQSAQKIAEYLESHAKVQKVYYPGLKSHPQHELAKMQMRGFGGMISFEVRGGLTAARKLLENVKIFALAESLGGVESLIEHPASMTHSYISPEEREKGGLTGSLVRISVGIEAVEDLLEDLRVALDKV